MLYNGQAQGAFSGHISLFVEKTRKGLAKRKNAQITPFLAQSACWQIWHSQTTDWLLGGLGYNITGNSNVIVLVFISVN